MWPPSHFSHTLHNPPSQLRNGAEEQLCLLPVSQQGKEGHGEGGGKGRVALNRAPFPHFPLGIGSPTNLNGFVGTLPPTPKSDPSAPSQLELISGSGL